MYSENYLCLTVVTTVLYYKALFFCRRVMRMNHKLQTIVTCTTCLVRGKRSERRCDGEHSEYLICKWRGSGWAYNNPSWLKAGNSNPAESRNMPPSLQLPLLNGPTPLKLSERKGLYRPLDLPPSETPCCRKGIRRLARQCA